MHKSFFIFFFILITYTSTLSADEITNTHETLIQENQKYKDMKANILKYRLRNKSIYNKERIEEIILCHRNDKKDCPPRRYFISSNLANRKGHKYTEYTKAWLSKIESVSNSDYFKEIIKNDNFQGILIIDTAINLDGSVNDIILSQSSENKAFDNLVVEMVNQAAPFQPFPEGFKDEFDILHISHIWQIIKPENLVSKEEQMIFLNRVMNLSSQLKESLSNNDKERERLYFREKCKIKKITGCQQRKKYISEQTREHKYVPYMKSWISETEQVINSSNYKTRISELNYQGSLKINTALNPDGSVNEVNVWKSSGNEKLDELVIEIIYEASPYPHFFEAFKDDIEILNISLTWKLKR